MIIYSNNTEGFRLAVDENRIVEEIEAVYQAKLGRRAIDAEKRSWQNSFQFMETVLRHADVANDCGVLVEYSIPSTSKRIDFLICGMDRRKNKNFVIVELKQWDYAFATEKDCIVKAFVGGGVREVTHPCYQADTYKRFLSDMNESIVKKMIHPYACAYLHNYQKKEQEPLTSSLYEPIIQDTPIFFREDMRKLGRFLSMYVGCGQGMDILYTIENGRIRPSKKFIEYISEIFEGNEVFTLLDEQKVAYESIVSNAVHSQEKTTLIINGEPGTGKSVVAMNAFVQILKHEKNVRFVAPNASFREAMTNMLAKSKSRTKSRLKVLFTGSSQYVHAKTDDFDVLIVDEAHRLKNKGAYQYHGENQIDDIIQASKVSVFFIDDQQRVRPEDIGAVEHIKQSAKKNGSKVKKIDLEAQFRCSGAKGYVHWITHQLQIKDTAHFDGWDKNDFEFAVVNSPHELYQKIIHKHRQGYKARLVAGYAWPWTSEKKGNPDAQINDVHMPEHQFALPWNSRKDQYGWAMNQDSIDQIGCIHTCQGLEFDYIGVLIGYDLQFDPKSMQVYGCMAEYYDRVGKKGLKGNPEECTALIKNIYKVLMTRGMKGCFVFCRDPNLAKRLKQGN